MQGLMLSPDSLFLPKNRTLPNVFANKSQENEHSRVNSALPNSFGFSDKMLERILDNSWYTIRLKEFKRNLKTKP